LVSCFPPRGRWGDFAAFYRTGIIMLVDDERVGKGLKRGGSSATPAVLRFLPNVTKHISVC